jgi:hypothetical protein
MVRTSELRDKMVWPERIRDAIYEDLISSGYYRTRPDKTKNAWILMAGLSFAWGFPLAQLAFRSASPMISPAAVTIAAVLSTLILFAFAPIMSARTAAGARALEATLGFKEFLSRVQDHRSDVMILSPETFDRFLPYAIALGVAGHWANAFEKVYNRPPQWYVGGTGQVTASSFSHTLLAMSDAPAIDIRSRPSAA